MVGEAQKDTHRRAEELTLDFIKLAMHNGQSNANIAARIESQRPVRIAVGKRQT